MLFIVAIATDGIDGWHRALARDLSPTSASSSTRSPTRCSPASRSSACRSSASCRGGSRSSSLVREVGITVWRLVELRRGNVVPASSDGKLKTLAQAVALSLALLPLWTVVGDWIFWVNWRDDGGRVVLTVVGGPRSTSRRGAARARGPRGALAASGCRGPTNSAPATSPRPPASPRAADSCIGSPTGADDRDGRVADRRAARGGARRRARRLGRRSRGSGGVRDAREALAARRRRGAPRRARRRWTPRWRSRWRTASGGSARSTGDRPTSASRRPAWPGPTRRTASPPGTVYVAVASAARHPLGGDSRSTATGPRCVAAAVAAAISAALAELEASPADAE